MQKLLITLLCAIALLGGTAHAATVEQILAAQPAQNTADQAKWSAALIALGGDAIVDLCTRLVPSGGGDDNAVRYALSGAAKHATRPGAEADRALVANAFADALAKVSNVEVRTFILQQIQFTGRDEVIGRVAVYLSDPDLAAPAAAALAAVGDTAAEVISKQAPAAPAAASAPAPAPQPAQAAPPAMDLRGKSGRELQDIIDMSTALASRTAALEQMATADSRRALRVCLDAIEGNDAAFRDVALAVAETLDEKQTSKRLLREIKQADPEFAHDLWRTVVRRGDAKAPPAPKGVDADGFAPLFNGVDLDGWDGNRIGYEAQNGILSSREGGKNIYTDDDYANFRLRFEFKLDPGSNNGLGIRVPLGGHAAYDGMELQILDDDDPQYADIKDYQHHGSVYGMVPAKPGFLRPDGEWNTQEVIANGDQITIILNGTTILDADIREAAKDGALDEKEHPGLLNKTGRLAFLGHNTPVWFRNIYVKKL